MRLPVNLLRHVRRAAAHRPAWQQLSDLLVHKLKVNIGPADYYDLQLYEDRWTWEEKSRCLGYNGSRYWPYEGNSLKFERLFSRKGMQKALMQGLGLPTPKLLALVGSDYPVSTLDGFRSLLGGIDTAFVIKPDGSLGGDDVMVLRPDGNGYRKGDESLSVEDVWAFYEGHLARGMIVEERAENHLLLDRIYPAALNTLRVISIQTRDRRWHHPHSYLRVGRGGAQVDNSMFGGLMVRIEDGVTQGQGWACNRDEWFEAHPDTGARFDCVELPFFEEALRLVHEACQHFGFMRTIGWDIALTPTGPMIIEANAFWNSKRIQLMIGPVITPEIATGLQARSWYTPWDRSHMYPNYRLHHAGGPIQRWHARRRARFATGGP